MSLHAVDPKLLTPDVFDVFGSRNALLTVGNRTACNPMTIGWCGLGSLWELPTCTVYVRPERYTYQLMEESDYFTVAVFDASYRREIALCGSKSGRDTDKVRECNFTVCYGKHDAPYFAEADWVLVCKKMYAQDFRPECAMDARIGKWYEAGGWHRMYVGEVVEAYQK